MSCSTDNKISYFKEFNHIHTYRLKIRKLALSDIDDVFEFTSIDSITKYLSWYAHMDKKQTEKFISSVIQKYEQGDCSQWGITIEETGKLIGIAGFVNYDFSNRTGEIAYIMSPHFWGKGYMPEALSAIIDHAKRYLNPIRIQAKCEISNLASEKVMQKIGMSLEGILRNYLIVKGVSQSFKMYSIIIE